MSRNAIRENQRNARQEQTREMLRTKGLIQHVLELSRKIEALDLADKDYVMSKLDSLEGLSVAAQAAVLSAGVEFDLKKYKATAELQLKLINKFLPDLKQVELDATIDDRRNADEFSDAELASIIASNSSRGVAEEADGKVVSTELH